MKCRRKKIAIAGLIIIVFFSGLIAFLFFYQVPRQISRSGNGRLVTIKVVSETPCEKIHSDRFSASRVLQDGDKLKDGERIELWMRICTLTSQNSHVAARTLYREAESVHVVYISITETPISLIRFERLYSATGGVRSQGYHIQTDAFQNIDSFPQNIEIYYLRNLHLQQRRISNLTDEQFDELRNNATPVWNGIIDVSE